MGYKTELFTSTVDENLCCSICREVFQDPVSCKSGHTFCSVCIREWLRTHHRCPVDNNALSEQDLVHSLALKGIIENLQVYCPSQDQSQSSTEAGPNKRPRVEEGHASDGSEKCGWMGKLSDLPRHQLTCPFQMIKCPSSHHCESLQRRQLEEHKRVCLFRRVTCKLCGMSLVYNDHTKHRGSDCPMELVPCTNKCYTSFGTVTRIRRCYLAEHLSNACDKAIVPCPFKDQGCVDSILQKDIEKHLQQNMTSHMLLLANENKHLKRELAKAKETNKMYTWAIEDYPSKASSHETGSCFSSPVFWLCGYKWRLSIYPNGKADELSLTVMLNRIDPEYYTPYQPNQITCEGLYANIVCSLSVLKAKPNESDFVRTFNVKMYKDANNWMNGWSNFMLSSQAVSPKYCNQNGVLNIQCTMQVTYTE